MKLINVSVCRAVLLLCMLSILSLRMVNRVYADDALVLPKGVFRIVIDSNNYLTVDKRYGTHGQVEDVATDYNRSLNSNAFPALAPLDPFVPGLPTIGRSDVSFDYNFNILETSLHYGLIDNLTIGVKVPYWWVKNRVKAKVDSGPGSGANVGKNPFFACGAPLCPLFVPGTTRLTTGDVQNLLGRGLDVNGDNVIDVPGFGYKRVETWSGNGLSDVEAGFRYQYLKTRDWRLAFTGGGRFPTGRVDDIDNLTDYEFGPGAYALLFHFNNDFAVSNLWKEKNASARSFPDVPEAGDLILNGTFKYSLVLPYHIKKRISNDVDNPITANKEKVKIDIGDMFEFEYEAIYTILRGLNFSALYRYGFKLRDRVSGNAGFAYESLEDETERAEHIGILKLSYSTVSLYREKKFPVPIDVSLSYRNRFAGKNNILRSQYIALGLKIYF